MSTDVQSKEKKDSIVEAREEQKQQETLIEFAKVSAEAQNQIKEGMSKLIEKVFEQINGLDKDFIKTHGAGLELLTLSYMMDISVGTTLSVVKQYYPDKMELAISPLKRVLNEYGFEVKKIEEKKNEPIIKL